MEFRFRKRRGDLPLQNQKKWRLIPIRHNSSNSPLSNENTQGRRRASRDNLHLPLRLYLGTHPPSTTTMAARILPFQSLLHLFQPVQYARQPLLSSPIIRRIFAPSITAFPLAAFSGVSDVLREIWDGLLRAVPKKKTSHRKKRQRQMAGNALKDVTNLVKCSACGKTKRGHVLCPYCVEGTFDHHL